MRYALRIVPVLILAGAAAAPGAEGPTPRAIAVHVEMEPLAVPGRALEPCAATRDIPMGTKATFRASFGRVRRDGGRPWVSIGSEARCEEAAGGEGSPYLVAELVVTPLRSSAAAIDIAVLVMVQRLSGFSPTGEPTYTDTVQHRTFSLEDGDAGLVALLVADAAEARDFGLDHLTLQIRVRNGTATAYGAISLRADSPETDVLLDGGLAGRTSKDATLTLWNVPATDTEVTLRAADGREATRLVRVRANRRLRVALGTLDPLGPRPNALRPIGTNHRGYEEYRRDRDDAVMVKVPAGEFLMGNLETEGRPAPHTVHLSAFLMDKEPVTWARYERFLGSSGRPLPPDEPYWGIIPDHPAVFVTWEESRAYCEWAGARLPTEAEREKAARGTDTRKYPWGDREPDPELAIFRRNWGSVATAAVGGRPAGESPYGLLDMAGNVWEWCEDWYDPAYYQATPETDPRGPATGSSRVVRGGSWDSRPSVLSASARNFGYRGYREGDFGFRCAADAP
jgi:formylglycine-generating enzyme required for sulfatase activity